LKNSQSKASLFYTGSYLGNIFIVIFLFSQLNFHFNFLLELTLGIYPYEVFSFTFGEHITNLLGIFKIPANEVTLKPSLAKQIKDTNK